MPRILPRLFWQAQRIDAFLPFLLPVCRDTPSARNELRWLREHAQKTSHLGNQKHILAQYVARRSRGEPLQYILSSEFFGPLEIKCKRGVLIPRPETASIVSHLAHLLSKTAAPTFRVLDLCTGTGCIALLFQHAFYASPSLINPSIGLETIGVDISPTALQLARENQQIQLRSRGHDDSPQTRALFKTHFIAADILREDDVEHISEADRKNPNMSSLPTLAQALAKAGISLPEFDVLIANPPYISTKGYLRNTSRSVRGYEPRLALVPTQQTANDSSIPNNDDNNDGDRFYPRLLSLAAKYNVRAVLLEVADMPQAERVAKLASQQGKVWGGGIEVWRDEPSSGMDEELIRIEGVKVRVRGTGNGRAVAAFRHGLA